MRSLDRGRRTPRLRRLAAPIALILSIGLHASAAADGVSFAVSPSRLVFSVASGATAAQVVTLYNQDDEPLELSIRVGDFVSDDARSAASTFAVTDWVRTDVTSVVLPGNGSGEVRVIVDVPVGAAPGGYQAGLFVESAPRGVGDVEVAGRLGAAVLIELEPEDHALRREIQVTGNELLVEFPDRFGLDALFRPRGRTDTLVTNVGETFVRAVAVDSYRAWTSNDPVDRQAPGTTILRGTSAHFRTDGPELPWFGPASVTTEIVYERGAQDYATIVVQADTFVVPWRLLALIFVLGMVAGAILAYRWRLARRGPEPAADRAADR